MSRRIVALVVLLLVGGCAGGRTATLQADVSSQVDDTRGRGDQSNAMTIGADRLERSGESHLAIFIGNVVLEDHDWLLSADRAAVYLDETGSRILRIIATGNVRITASGCRKGRAERAVYRSMDQRVVLSGKARVWPPQGFAPPGGDITLYVWRSPSRVTDKCGPEVPDVDPPPSPDEGDWA